VDAFDAFYRYFDADANKRETVFVLRKVCTAIHLGEDDPY